MFNLKIPFFFRTVDAPSPHPHSKVQMRTYSGRGIRVKGKNVLKDLEKENGAISVTNSSSHRMLGTKRCT